LSAFLYLESSAILRGLLEADKAVLAAITPASKLLTSALTAVEVERALLRAFLDKRIGAEDRRAKRQWFRELLGACEIVELGASVLERGAQPFPLEPVRTLDALHLASAVLFEQAMGVAVGVLSVDERVRRNATELGLAVLPGSN